MNKGFNPKDPDMSRERDFPIFLFWRWEWDHKAYSKKGVWILRAKMFAVNITFLTQKISP